MPLAHFWRDPAAMQLLHYAIASSTVALVLWFAPFSWYEKALFPFGYFTLYEYAVKSRNYALGSLLLMAFCVLWPRRRSHPIWMAVVLALMANVHALFMILSIAAFAALVIDRIFGRVAGSHQGILPTRNLFAVLIVISGWTIAATTAWPPSDSGFDVEWGLFFSPERIKMVLHSTNILSWQLRVDGKFGSSTLSWVAAIASLAAIVIAGVLFWRSPAGLFLSASFIGTLAFYYLLRPTPPPRFLGVIFFAWIACIWVGRLSEPLEPIVQTQAMRRVFAVVFGVTLLTQAWNGIGAVRTDYQHPFSNGFAVARYIQSQGWQDDPLAGVTDATMATIIGYLGVNRAYFLQGCRWGSFTVFDQARLPEVDWEHALARVRSLGPRVSLVISAYTRVDAALLIKSGFKVAAEFDGATIGDENYVLYRSGQ
jgi:hypothetical protein